MKQTYSRPQEIEQAYPVSKSFILEAHAAACTGWKAKIEEQFPSLFPKKEEVISLKKYKRSLSHYGTETQSFYFSVGDTVRIYDGSYQTNSKGERLERLGLEKPKGIIVYNKCPDILIHPDVDVSLNLIIHLEDGRIIHSSPICVEHI